MSSPVTLVRNPIQRPDDPRHFMVIKPLAHRVTATLGDTVIAESSEAVRVQEAGRDLYDPVIYFPRDHVQIAALRKNDRTTHCPLKGDTEYFDADAHDNVAWSYHHVLDFDPRLQTLSTRIAFDTARVQIVEHTAK